MAKAKLPWISFGSRWEIANYPNHKVLFSQSKTTFILKQLKATHLAVVRMRLHRIFCKRSRENLPDCGGKNEANDVGENHISWFSNCSRKIHVLLYKQRLYKLTVKVGNAIPILQDITHHSNASVIFLLSFKASRLFLEGNYVWKTWQWSSVVISTTE